MSKNVREIRGANNISQIGIKDHSIVSVVPKGWRPMENAAITLTLEKVELILPEGVRLTNKRATQKATRCQHRGYDEYDARMNYKRLEKLNEKSVKPETEDAEDDQIEGQDIVGANSTDDIDPQTKEDK